MLSCLNSLLLERGPTPKQAAGAGDAQERHRRHHEGQAADGEGVIEGWANEHDVGSRAYQNRHRVDCAKRRGAPTPKRQRPRNDFTGQRSFSGQEASKTASKGARNGSYCTAYST
jgi:hypothetical protein